MIFIELMGFGFRSQKIEENIREAIFLSDFSYKNQIRIVSCVCTGAICKDLQGKESPAIKIAGGGEMAGEIKKSLLAILKKSTELTLYL